MSLTNPTTGENTGHQFESPATSQSKAGPQAEVMPGATETLNVTIDQELLLRIKIITSSEDSETAILKALDWITNRTAATKMFRLFGKAEFYDDILEEIDANRIPGR